MSNSTINRFNLEERLINFAVLVVDICEKMPDTRASNHLSGQLIRSGTSPALNYGEAQSAESKKDFIHKIGIIMKELRETQVNLTMISRLTDASFSSHCDALLSENDELLAIFFTTLRTARSSRPNH